MHSLIAAAFTAKAAAWPTAIISKDGRPQSTQDTPRRVIFLFYLQFKRNDDHQQFDHTNREKISCTWSQKYELRVVSCSNNNMNGSIQAKYNTLNLRWKIRWLFPKQKLFCCIRSNSFLFLRESQHNINFRETDPYISTMVLISNRSSVTTEILWCLCSRLNIYSVRSQCLIFCC